MKTKTTFFKIFLFLIAFTLATACKKGDPGPAGEKGERGVQGLNGADGNTILSGNGIPSAGTGKVGDYYLDLTTSNLYGPKTANGWGNGINLKGANGATGATGSSGSNGKTILSGNGVPSINLGVDGDFYVDLTTYNLYGPKLSGSWGSPTSLIGPAGRVSYSELGLTDIAALDGKMTKASIIGTNENGAIFTPESIFIFKTNENRYGKFKVTKIDLLTYKLSIVFTVYNVDGTIKIAEKALDINSLNYFDFDAGLANSDANAQNADLRWGRATTVQSYLEVNNTAKLLQYK